ncbi:hypothetical protein M514_25388 [Trichuris suis]|uniref:Uncharacterized protein n=1 Tax=Trichuris suis TaxID=68888 RepID=A0A085MZ09_9BILA|nr:hypothetical protein M514_25388 [Trichuris suis]
MDLFYALKRQQMETQDKTKAVVKSDDLNRTRNAIRYLHMYGKSEGPLKVAELYVSIQTVFKKSVTISTNTLNIAQSFGPISFCTARIHAASLCNVRILSCLPHVKYPQGQLATS